MKTKQWSRIWIVLLVAAVFLTSLQILAASESALAQLKPGMSKASVIQIMGKPDAQGEKHGEELCSWFTYKNVGHYKYVNVWFDCAEKLVAVDKATK